MHFFLDHCVLLCFNALKFMAYINELDPPNTVPTPDPPDRNRPVLIGAFVPVYIKESLQREARTAPGGPRTLSWVLNSILAQHVNDIKDTK